MASTAAERKAQEKARKTQLGLKRKWFWLDEKSMEKIERYKHAHGLKTNDAALIDILKKIP